MFSALSTITEQAFEHYFLDIKLNLSRQLSIQTHLNNLNKNLPLTKMHHQENAIYIFFNIDVLII